jgi:hypothetical protein
MDPRLRQVREELLLQTPAKAFEYLSVTFPSTADTDWAIATALAPEDPEGLIYQLVRADRACYVYHDQSSTRVPWKSGQMILRCSAANASVLLRVEIPRAKSVSFLPSHSAAPASAAVDADTLDTLHAASFARVDVSQTANFVLAAPNGSAGNPTFRLVTKSDVGLGSVENTALSTWVGSAYLATVGSTVTIGAGNGTVQSGGADSKLILKAGGTAGNVDLIATGTAGASVNFFSHDTGLWQAYIWKGDLVLKGTGYQKGSIYWTDTSDRKLKTNIRPYRDGLSIVRQLRPMLYRSTGVDGKDPNRDYISVIADDVETLLPCSVGRITFKDGDGTEYRTFNATEMFWSMLVAIQELDARVTAALGTA